MKQITHSKYKNTGLLFELLVRQITSDTLKGKESPALDIIKKYFIKTELGKEYKLYESIIKSQPLNESKANLFINTIVETSKKLNKKNIKSLKYNLIKEIRENYDVDVFFSSKIKSYKELAAIYTLIEASSSTNMIDPQQVVNNNITLLEHLTKQSIKEEEKENLFKEFETYDKDLRILTYKILLEKFNQKYNLLNNEQKIVLKEFIYSTDSTPQLREFYNNKITEIRKILLKETKQISDKVTKIKISEILKYLVEIDKNEPINNEHLIDLLQYYELIEEIKKINGK